MSQDESGGGADEKPATPAIPEAQDAELWEAETPDGVVRKVTLDQLNDAFLAGRVDGTTRVRAPGTAEWTSLEQLLAETPPPQSAPAVLPAPRVPSIRPRAPSLRPPEVYGRRPRPVLGPAITVFGVLLWAFVVMGEFTTSWNSGAPLEEGTAIVLVVLATLTAWVFAMQGSTRVRPAHGTPRLIGRSLLVGLVAFLLWCLFVVMAAAVGKASSKSPDVAIASFLIVVAALAARAGPRLTTRERPPPTRARRAGGAVLWIGVAMVTLGACVEMVRE
jgi:hypothetical protein